MSGHRDCCGRQQVVNARDERRVPVPADPDLRVSQAERDEVAAALARHYADGRLALDEYEDRVGRTMAARTGHDLVPLLADLPTGRRTWDGQQDSGREPGPSRHSVRGAVVCAVVVLAIVTSPWVLWLLWPALALTGGGCGSSRPVVQRPGQLGSHPVA